MQDAISGISTIWAVIGVGWLIAHLGLINTPGRKVMAALAFSVGSPALLFSLMARADLDHLFSRTLLVSVLAVLVAGGGYLLLAALVFRPTLGGTVIGSLAACYTNAANFGLPVAIALLGDGTWMAPILLLQVGLLQPAALVVLDLARARADNVRLSVARYALLPVRNPITVAILAGLLVNLVGLEVPGVLLRPVEMIGAIAVPLMLLAFGVSLRLDPLPGAGPDAVHLWATVALKVVAHPLAAWVIGRYAFGLTGLELYAVVVLGCLPAAQNVHVVATRYDESELLARDAVFWSTILSVGSLLTAAALLG